MGSGVLGVWPGDCRGDGFPGFGPCVGALLKGLDAVAEGVGGVFVGQGAFPNGVLEEVQDVAVLGVEPGEFGDEDGECGVVRQVGRGVEDLR